MAYKKKVMHISFICIAKPVQKASDVITTLPKLDLCTNVKLTSIIFDALHICRHFHKKHVRIFFDNQNIFAIQHNTQK